MFLFILFPLIILVPRLLKKAVLISGVSRDSMVTRLIRIELGTFSELWLKNPLCPGYILVISMKLLVVMGKKVVCFARLLRKMLTQINAFSDALLECGLFDLGWIGCKYIWSNNHCDNTWTRLRSNRGTA